MATKDLLLSANKSYKDVIDDNSIFINDIFNKHKILDTEHECAICLETINKNNILAIPFKCNHVFCYDCIKPVMKYPIDNRNCPLCRKFLLALIIGFFDNDNIEHFDIHLRINI